MILSAHPLAPQLIFLAPPTLVWVVRLGGPACLAMLVQQCLLAAWLGKSERSGNPPRRASHATLKDIAKSTAERFVERATRLYEPCLPAGRKVRTRSAFPARRDSTMVPLGRKWPGAARHSGGWNGEGANASGRVARPVMHLADRNGTDLPGAGSKGPNPCEA